MLFVFCRQERNSGNIGNIDSFSIVRRIKKGSEIIYISPRRISEGFSTISRGSRRRRNPRKIWSQRRTYLLF